MIQKSNVNNKLTVFYYYNYNCKIIDNFSTFWLCNKREFFSRNLLVRIFTSS